MSQSSRWQTTPPQRRPVWRQTIEQWSAQGLQLVVQLLATPGSGIFASLLIANVLLLLTLLLINPANGAVIVASLCLAAALPLDIAGLWVNGYIADVEQALTEGQQQLAQVQSSVQGAIEDEETHAFSMMHDLPQLNAKLKGAVQTSKILLALCVFFSLVGLGATLWHIHWLITVIFLISLLATILLIQRFKSPF